MPLYEILPDELQDVDVIIAGGGTSGCVVAARLADADPSMSILIIEGGPDNFGVATITHPGLFLTALMPTSKTTIFYKGKPESQLNNRELVVPSGGTLGGGSSVNFMVYSRAQRSDFDSWQTPGWSANDILPYLKKMETYHGPDPKSVHGASGPLNISRGTYVSPRSEQDFIQAAERVGYPEVADLTTLDDNNGVSRALRYIGPDGKRQDTAHRYLHPRLQSGKFPNLHVVVGSRVKRVVFEGERASGVEFVSDAGSDPATTLRIVRAKKLVVLSCGALGTPSVLERSGVGNPEILKKAGVGIVIEAPGVGEEYQDHHLMVYPYNSSLTEEETFDALISGRMNATELMQQHAPILGWNAMDTTFKWRPIDNEISSLGLNFQRAWNDEFRDDSNKPLALGSLVNGFPGDPSTVPTGQYFAMSIWTGYPYSRGSIHITGPGLDDPVDFATGFLSDTQGVDLKKHVWAYKKQREVCRRMETYRGEIAAGHPPFNPESKAACVQIKDGNPHNINDLHYTNEDDKIIEDFVRKNVGTTWHSLGTCKMGPRQEKGVVGTNLSVHGVKGLKIADMSIPPRNVAANTMSTAVAIAERASDIIIQELGLDHK